MSYQLFEIPSENSNKPQSDIVWADVELNDRDAIIT